MTGEKARARRAKVNTAGHGKSSGVSIPSAPKLTKRGQSGKQSSARQPKAWDVQNALEIVADTIKDVESAGQANGGLPAIRVSSIGAMTEGQPPRVMIVLVGAYYCETCHALTFAATVAEAKCERCTGGEA